MSTRSAIIIENTDKTVAGIYCHFDGYLDGVGKTLLESYQDEAKVRELIALGDISSLGDRIGTKHDFSNAPDGEVNAYGRDRGEDGCEPKTGANWRQVAGKIGHNGYIYVWSTSDRAWMFARDESADLAPLKDAREPSEE